MATDNERSTDNRVEEALRSGGGHAIAIGFYISAIVLIIGAILLLYGLLGPEQQANKSLGININLWWGAFMILFGFVVLIMSYASPRRRGQRR